MTVRLALGGLIVLITSMAQARVFNMANESFALYLRGSLSPSFENTLSSKSSGENVSIDADHPYGFSGELGMLYATSWVNFRFGLELIKPGDIEASTGESSASDLYSMDSEISVMIPKVGLEFNLRKWSASRFYLATAAGYANLAARNSYTMTTAGTAATGLTDFSEDLRANAMAYEASIGFETLLTDTTTLVAEAGYRRLVFNEVKQNKDVTGFQGPVVKGDRATNMAGDNRTLDLTTAFVGLALRFWLK